MLSRWWRLAASVLAVVVLLPVGWFLLQAYPLGGPGRAVIVVVQPGDSLRTIAGRLQSAGVISSAFAFDLDTLVQGSPLVLPGGYSLRQGSTFTSIRGQLSAGPNVATLDVVPGLTLPEMRQDLVRQLGATYAAQFSSALAAAAAVSPYHPANDSLEGLVGPGEYVIPPGESASELVAQMRTSFIAEARAAGLTPTTRRFGLSAYQLLTGASIVVKEGYYPSNMPKVARVILNRLARHDALQMDSTVLYALGRDGGTVTPAMLQTNSPYNTYLYAGLTPTPICVVSPAALAAMLNPPPGPWQYFVVVDKQGTMAFSTTYAEQLANEARAKANGV